MQQFASSALERIDFLRTFVSARVARLPPHVLRLHRPNPLRSPLQNAPMIARSCLALLLLGIIVTLSLDQSVLLRFANLSALEYRTAASLSHAGVNYSTCALPDLDPWDPASIRFFTPNHDPLRDCKPKVAVMTSVVDGEVILDKNLIPKEERKKNFVCFYRCLHPKGDRKIAFGNWTNIEVDNRPKCDVIETKCGSDPKKWTFRYLHHQIYVEKETTSTSDSHGRSKRRSFGTTEREEGIERPDVFLMVIDSVSSSSMIRALQQTMHLLREEFDAVVFRHLNKVGKNSRPNGFAFLTGRQIYNIHKSPYSEAIDAELSFKEWCQTPLDNLSFAGFPYRNEGYKTMMAEDWAAGVFNWPSCVGFADRPVDHYMRPFQLRVGGHGWGKDSGLKSLVFRQSCKEPHMAILDYTEQFLKAYANEPKLGITWLTDVKRLFGVVSLVFLSFSSATDE